jgi:hypothetical protein
MYLLYEVLRCSSSLSLVIIMGLLSYRQYLKLEGSGGRGAYYVGPARALSLCWIFKYPGGCSDPSLNTPVLRL